MRAGTSLGRTCSLDECDNKNFVYGLCTPHYRERYRDKINDANRENQRKIRAEVLREYGGVCVCCGESTPEFLGIDHIFSDGGKERRELRISGSGTYLKLRRDGFPKDRYQLLCHNCNQAQGYYKMCPHEKERLDKLASAC